MNFTKRITKLERFMVPKRPPRIVLRYEGPGSERFPRPTQEELDDGWPVITMRFVAAKDGRPVEPDDVDGEGRILAAEQEKKSEMLRLAEEPLLRPAAEPVSNRKWRVLAVHGRL